jgi:PST family polysaccharide transporter
VARHYGQVAKSVSDPTSEDPFEVALEAEGLKRRSLQGSLATGVSQIIRIVLQIGSQIILARLLFPSDFGLLAMVYPVIGFVQIFNDIGLGQAIVQRPTLIQAQVSALFWVNIGVSLLLAVVVTAAAPLAALAYQEPKVIGLMVVLSATIPIAALGIIPSALLMRQMRFGLLARNETITAFGGIATAVIGAMLGWSYWALVAAQFVSATLGVALVWAGCGWRASYPKVDRSVWADLRFGGNLTGANLATFVTTSGDNLLVGVTAGRVALGLYDRSYKLVVQPLGQMLAPISRVAVPLLSRFANQPDQYRTTYLQIVRALLLLTVPGILVCVTYGHELVAVFLGSRWTAAAPIFSWICVGGLTSSIYTSAYWLFVSQDRTKDLMHVTVAASLINVISYLVGAIWGVVGIAMSASIVFALITTPLMLYKATRKGPVSHNDLYRVVLPFIFSGAAIYAVLLAMKASLALTGLAEIVLATVVAYGGFTLLILILPGGARFIDDLRRMVALLRAPEQ